MKLKITLIALLLLNKMEAQTQLDKKTIDSSNYYEYVLGLDASSPVKKLKGSKLFTDWIKLDEALPVLREEMAAFGCSSLREYELKKIDTAKFIHLSIYCPDADFGFVFPQNHYLIPKREHRYIKAINELNVYSGANGNAPVGKPTFANLDSLPPNIILLSQDCYWYQHTDDKADDKYFVTKDIALKILRQDIRHYLAALKK